MQNRCMLQVVFALSSLILSKAKDVIGSGHSCLRSSLADDGQTRVTFLREDAAGARSLYITLWSEDKQPVTCEVNTNPLVTERYRAHCDRSGTQGQDVTKRFNISMLLAPDAPCALASSSAPEFTRRTRRDGSEGKVRSKRAWIFPGTLWCGTGSKAATYEQLGMFENADRCCREHDHCLHVILGFTVNYGVFNRNFFTVSHCDCDQRFRQCLLSVNDTISSMVGHSFFSIMQVPCFEFRLQRRCAEMYWWGKCKVVEKAAYAIFKKPLPYNSSDVASKHGNKTDNSMFSQSEGQHVTDSVVINPHGKSPKSEHRCSSRDPTRKETFHLKRTKGKGCKRRSKLYTVAPSPMPPMSSAHTTTPSMKTTLLSVSKSSTLMPNKNRAGKKSSTREGLSAYSTQGSQVPPQVTTSSYPQTTSTTHSTPPVTKTTLQLHLPTTTIAEVTKTAKNRKKVPKKSRCCGSGTRLRGDTFQPHCKSCREQNTTSHMTTATPSTTTHMTTATPSTTTHMTTATPSTTTHMTTATPSTTTHMTTATPSTTTHMTTAAPSTTTHMTTAAPSTTTHMTTATPSTTTHMTTATPSATTHMTTATPSATTHMTTAAPSTTTHMTTATPSATTYGLPTKVATAAKTLRLKKTTETSKQVTLKRLWSTTTSATPVTTKLKMATSIHKDGRPQQQMESPLLQNNTYQESVGGAIAQSTHAERGLKQNIALHNMTDNQLLCGSLKHLDNCKYKIGPLEKKYDLQNTESKTAYHCDCTSRLAVQTESFKQPSIVPTLLMDFVSQYCFRLPKGKKCQHRKSCSGGFTKASDLLQALKMIEEKGIAGVRNSGYNRRRGIPVRLYKRCLRLERQADIMAQLT